MLSTESFCSDFATRSFNAIISLMHDTCPTKLHIFSVGRSPLLMPQHRFLLSECCKQIHTSDLVLTLETVKTKAAT
jgi:hypothetical protein